MYFKENLYSFQTSLMTMTIVIMFPYGILMVVVFKPHGDLMTVVRLLKQKPQNYMLKNGEKLAFSSPTEVRSRKKFGISNNSGEVLI